MPLLYCMYVHRLVFATTRFLAKPVTYYNKLRSILKKIDYKFQEFCCPKRRNLMRSTLKFTWFFFGIIYYITNILVRVPLLHDRSCACARCVRARRALPVRPIPRCSSFGRLHTSNFIMQRFYSFTAV